MLGTDGEEGRLKLQKTELVDGDGARREHDAPTSPGDLVQSLSVNLHRRVPYTVKNTDDSRAK